MAKKILLAEDSITMQKVVQMTFAAEDFTVTAVSTAEGAIQQAKDLKPDIVIADLSMDGKNGYDVCTAVKSDPSLAGTRVLLLHGSAAPYDPAKGKAAKADGDMAKPFETQALIEKVTALAEAAPEAAKEAIGPIESLSPPMGGGGEDIVIDTESLGAPAKAAPPKPAASPKPAAPPKPAAAKPVAPPKPVAPKPVAPPKPAAPRPAAAKPVAPPAKPAPLKPVVPPKPAVAAKPAAPAAQAPDSQQVEITIEAEPPPAGAGMINLPGFDEPPRTDATLLGVGKPAPPAEPAPAKQPLPPPPAGMPLPPTAAAPPPVQPGQPYGEPAVYEAITKLSRDVIERIVWEVVPDLAEQIIREELDRLVEKRRSS